MNVCFLQPEGKDGCSHYRLNQFALHSGLNCYNINPNLPIQYITETLSISDVYVARLTNMVAYHLIDTLKTRKKPLLVDIDDNYETVDPLADMYLVYGTREVKLPDGSWLWKNGVNGFDAEKNKARLEKYKEVMRQADGIIVTTFTLRNYALQYNKNVIVIPNAIDFDLFPSNVKVEKDKGRVDVMFSGGSSHFADLRMIQRPMEDLMVKYPQLHFNFLGNPFKGIVKNMPKDRVHTKWWITADGHGYRLATIGADIGICPLVDNDFNIYKSSIKYYELSALKIPTLASNVLPYLEDVKEGVTGFLWSSEREFMAKMSKLIEDPILRITLAKSAYEQVRRTRDIKEIAKDWKLMIEGFSKAYANSNGHNGTKRPLKGKTN